MVLGIITLLVARLAALIEMDTKKVIALSTLSQLGLMYVALFIGGPIIALFHLLIHAFAKANLFIIVGNILHSRFSQQDIRLLSRGRERRIIFLIVFIRIVSLRGVIFTAGFFSKDYILSSHYSLVNRIISFFLILGIITLTLTYCVKVFVKLLISRFFNLSFSSLRLRIILPGVFLRILRMVSG